MPTTKPRHQVTETPEIARALDAAARRWPGEPRSKLLVRLVTAGGQTVTEQEQQLLDQRRRALEHASQRFGELFGATYLVELRDDWPA